MAIREFRGTRLPLILNIGGSWPSVTQSYPSPPIYDSYVRSEKMDHVKRKKPIGIELLFNGVGFQHARTVETCSMFRYGSGIYWYTAPVRYQFNVGSFSDRANPPDLTSRLHARIKDQKVNLAMMLAEYRETASLFVDLSTRVAGAWRALRRGDIRKLRRAIGGRGDRKFSSNWLAYQYGVMPLYLEMQGALEVLDGALEKGLPVRKIRLSSQDSWSDSFSELWPTYGLTAAHKRFEEAKRVWTCYYTVDSDSIRTASSLGFTNPLMLAWELVPYSFVIDWFINVGDYLGSIDTLYGVNRICVYQGIRRTKHHSVAVGGGSASYTRMLTQRSGPLSLPNVRLGTEPSLSWRRIVSGVALLRQSRKL